MFSNQGLKKSRLGKLNYANRRSHIVCKRKSRTVLSVEQLEDRVLLDSSIHFSTDHLSVLSTDAVAQTSVVVSPTATEDGEFYCLVTGGTATEGVDFYSHQGHFTFSSGASSVVATLIHPINTSYQPDRTVELEMVPVSGVTVGAPSTITVTIVNPNARCRTPIRKGRMSLRPTACVARTAGGHVCCRRHPGVDGFALAAKLPGGRQPRGTGLQFAVRGAEPVFLVRYTRS